MNRPPKIRWSESSLRVRLFLGFSLVLALPLGLAGALALQSAGHRLIEAGKLEGLLRAEALVRGMQGGLNAAHADLLRLSLDPAFITPSPERSQTAVLSRFLAESQRNYHAGVMLDLHGKELLRREHAAPSVIGPAPPDAEMLVELVFKTLQISSVQRDDVPVYLSPPYWDEHGPMLRLSTLVKSTQAGQDSVLFLEWPVEEYARPLSLPGSPDPWIIDADGRLLIHPSVSIDGPPLHLRTLLPDALPALKKPSGVLHAGIDGVPHLLIHHRIRPPGLAQPILTALWPVPVAQFQEPVVRLQQVLVVATLFALGFGLVLTWLMANHLMRPLTALTRSVLALARGHYDAPLPERGPAEVILLANAFADMRSAVQLASEELQSQLEEALQVQARLGEHEGQLRSIIERAPAAIAIRDQDGRILLSNSHWGSLMPWWGDHLTVEEQHVLAHGEPMAGERRQDQPDGAAWATVTFPVDNLGRRAVCTIATDIGPRLALEARMAGAQRMEAIGQLAGGVAHDFNNLLAVIGGHAELLDRKMGKDPQVARHLPPIRAAANRAAEITAKLLTFGRQKNQAGGSADVGHTVRETLILLERLLGERIRVVIHPGPDDLPVPLDASSLTQVLMNLVINARDAMPEGGSVTIGWRRDDGTTPPADLVAGLPFRPGSCAVLSVTDTGIGMAPSLAARIFDPFFTTKGPDHGTGLGLSVVFGLVRSVGGFLTLRSAPGQGSTFGIHLPVAQSILPASVQLVPTVARRRIAVVEDDGQVRQLLVDLLEADGHLVTAYHDGESAAQALTTSPPEILVSDVVMPGMNGPDLIQVLRSHHPVLPVILLTGWSADHDLHRFPGVVTVRKPMSPDDLRQAIATVTQT